MTSTISPRNSIGLGFMLAGFGFVHSAHVLACCRISGIVTEFAWLSPDLTRQVLDASSLIHAYTQDIDVRASQTNWKEARGEYSTTY